MDGIIAFPQRIERFPGSCSIEDVTYHMMVEWIMNLYRLSIMKRLAFGEGALPELERMLEYDPIMIVEFG